MCFIPIFSMLHKQVHPGIALIAIASMVSLFALVTVTTVQASSESTRGSDAQILHPAAESEAAFRLRMRAVQAKAQAGSARSVVSSSSVSSLPPCNPAPVASSVSSVSSSGISTVADLTLSQLDTLRQQIRSRVCPVHGDPGYIAICQKLLTTELKRNPRPDATGLVNPNQARANMLRSQSSSVSVQ